MRTLKIIVISFILATLGGLALFQISNLIPTPGGGDEFDSIYGEHEGSEDEENYDINFKKLEGIVKPLGVSIYREGSHRLESDNKLVALLESKEFDLYDYEHKQVEVEGIVRDAVEEGIIVMSVSKVKVTDELLEEQSVLDEVGYNFHFVYPSSWLYTKGVGKLIFYESGDEKEIPLITVYQYSNVSVPLEAWLDQEKDEIDFREIHIKVGDQAGYRKTGSDSEGMEIIKSFTKDEENDLVYEIRYVGNNQSVKTHYLNIVDNFKIGALEIKEESEEVSENEGDESTTEDTNTSESQIAATPATNSSNKDQDQKTTVTPPVAQEKPSAQESTPDTSSTEQTGASTDAGATSSGELSTDEIKKATDSGFKLFVGSSLSFEYPRIWVFGYIGEGYYMMTDWNRYVADGEELIKDHARIFILVGDQTQSCVTSKKKDIAGTIHTVCALQSGLESIVDRIAESLSK